ncbi:MAG: winged helix-turn-helix domain-containing protein [Candidatus Aenigmarchaeota archaeon]|nr:winged helix-turn-helix domain-containing protein [Candidatus Aenigmarchaeota archaeon]
MVTCEEFFGANAGKVWAALKSNGPMTAAKLCESAELEEREVRGALGWLGREDKIKIDQSHKNFVYSLNE